jgi:hypothetical protein
MAEIKKYFVGTRHATSLRLTMVYERERRIIEEMHGDDVRKRHGEDI